MKDSFFFKGSFIVCHQEFLSRLNTVKLSSADWLTSQDQRGRSGLTGPSSPLILLTAMVKDNSSKHFGKVIVMIEASMSQWSNSQDCLGPKKNGQFHFGNVFTIPCERLKPSLVFQIVFSRHL